MLYLVEVYQFPHLNVGAFFMIWYVVIITTLIIDTFNSCGAVPVTVSCCVCVPQEKSVVLPAPSSSSPATTVAVWIQAWSVTRPHNAATPPMSRNAKTVSNDYENKRRNDKGFHKRHANLNCLLCDCSGHQVSDSSRDSRGWAKRLFEFFSDMSLANLLPQ